MSIKDNFDRAIKKIEAATKEAGRSPEGVKLVAVSKTVGSDKIREAFCLGQRSFAESRPQVLRDKAKELGDLAIEWHFIGRLQSNKIKYVYPVAAMVHSIDRRELLEEFVLWAKKTGKKCPALLQVHISREESKQGFECEEILGVINEYRLSQYLDIRGMMGMAPLGATEVRIKACFEELKKLFEASRRLEGPSYRAIELSMGMSGDFPIAIGEGATIVRLGTALFS